MADPDKLQKYVREGVLAEKRKKLEGEETRIDRLVKDVTYALYMVDGVKSIKMKAAKQAMDELDAAFNRWQQLKKGIKKLEQNG